MQRRYTFNECYAVLAVDPKTFRSWLVTDGITAETSRADSRIKFLLEDQVQRLAALHERPWPPVAPEAEVIPAASYKLLLAQVAQVVQQTAQFPTQIDELRQKTRVQESQLVQVSGEIADGVQEAELQRDVLRQEYQQALLILQEQVDLGQKTLELKLTDQAVLLEANQQQHAELAKQTRDQIDVAKRLIEQEQTAIREIKKFQQDLAAHLDTFQLEIQQHQKQERRDLDTWRQDLEDRLRSLTTESATQGHRIDALQKDLLQRLDVLQKDLQTSTDSQLKDATNAMTSMQTTLRQDLERRITDLSTTSTHIQKQIEQVIAQMAQSAIQATEREHTAQQARQEDQRRIEALESRLATSETRLQAEQKVRETLTQRLDTLEKHLAESETRLQVERVARESLTQRLEAIEKHPDLAKKKK